jgi:hypothetical protein
LVASFIFINFSEKSWGLHEIFIRSGFGSRAFQGVQGVHQPSMIIDGPGGL